MSVTRYIAELAANTGLTESAHAPTIYLKSEFSPAEWNVRSLVDHVPNYRDPDFIGTMAFEVVDGGRRVIYADIFAAHGYGPGVVRYETHAMRAGKERRIIKINMARGTMHFVTEESLERDDPNPTFERKGNKIKWFNVTHEERLNK